MKNKIIHEPTDLTEFFSTDQMKTATACQRIVGQADSIECRLIYEKHADLFEKMEVGLFVGACESCKYSSEELKIYKAGLMAITTFMQMARDEHKQDQNETVQKEEKKERQGEPTF